MRVDGLVHAAALTHDHLRRLLTTGHLSIRGSLPLLIALVLIPLRLPLSVALKILIGIGPLLVPATLVDQTIVVFGMLEVVLCRDSITGGLGIPRESDVFFQNLESITADSNVRTIRVETL